ncbi:uncharacterized protein LOC115424129 [Sphaeramia orbicularis]|uniref:uncharacterized protein LOC115424129 n=1 Tax=Sphaeramia orbicularis TaxID=375764 RepID=UPI00117C232B|nr:uncharacterized protein LOC115424129 [Sphaeramia orbicularis]
MGGTTCPSDPPPATPPPISSKTPDAAGPMAVLPSGRTGTWTRFLDRRVLKSRLASAVCGTDGPWWTEVDQMGFRVNLPIWFVSDDPEGQRSALRCPTAVWFLPPAQTRTLTEDNVSDGRLVCRDWTLRRSGGLRGVPGSGGLRGVPGSGGLQDHQGGTSLEELEAFIDSYVQIWEQTMESCYGGEPEPDQVSDQRGDDVLATISEKLSKLDVLEEIRLDLAELKKSLETSLRSIEEFRENSQKDPQSPL